MNQNILLDKIKSLPEELENKIFNYFHGLTIHKINCEIKKYKYMADKNSSNFSRDLNIYGFWNIIGLKNIPMRYWLKVKKHHVKYKCLCLWNGLI